MKNYMNEAMVRELPEKDPEFERFGYKATKKDRLFLVLAVIIMLMITTVAGV